MRKTIPLSSKKPWLGIHVNGKSVGELGNQTVVDELVSNPRHSNHA